MFLVSIQKVWDGGGGGRSPQWNVHSAQWNGRSTVLNVRSAQPNEKCVGYLLLFPACFYGFSSRFASFFMKKVLHNIHQISSILILS